VPDPDLIVSWNDLEEYGDQLGVDVIKKEDRVILCEISGNPPTVSFSLTIFSNFSILCYRGSTKVSSNDLISGFTYKIERYSQIPNILERLMKSEHNIKDECQQAARNINNIVESADRDEDERSKIKFLTDQLFLQSRNANGLRY
jgi:hypothetical protein